MTRCFKMCVALVIALVAAAGNPQDALSETREAGEVFRDCEHCPQMVVVPLYDGINCYFSICYAVGLQKVTFAEWDACASAGGCGGYRPDHDGRGRGRRSVVNVSWNDAQSYAAWLSSETGQAYRLLVESDLEAIWRRWPYDLEWRLDRWRYDLEWNHGEWVRACPITGIDIHGDNCFVRVIRGGIREGGDPKNRLRYSDRFDSDVRFADIGFRVIIDPASHYRGMER